MSEFEFILEMNRKGFYEEAAKSVEQLNGKPVPLFVVLEYAYALEMTGKVDEALDLIKSAMDAEPSEEMAVRYVSAICRLGRRRHDEVDALIGKYPNSRWLKAAKGEMALLDGDYKAGFELQRNRWAVNPAACRRNEFKCPEWDGEEFDGPLLVIGEQGLGEDILFSAALRNLEGTVVMGCDPRLIPLFKRSHPNVQFVPRQALRYFDQPGARVIEAMDLFGMNDHMLLTSTPWLTPDPRRSMHYQGQIVAAFGDRKSVGISWASARAKLGESKTIPLVDLSCILKDPRLVAIMLQYGNPKDDLATAESLGLPLFCIDDLDLTDDLDGVAALIAALDCVVTCSNTVAHLAGALGKKTYLMAPGGRFVLWYWGREGTKTPFYPSMEIFRGPPQVSWVDLAERVREKVNTDLLTTVQKTSSL